MKVNLGLEDIGSSVEKEIVCGRALSIPVLPNFWAELHLITRVFTFMYQNIGCFI